MNLRAVAKLGFYCCILGTIFCVSFLGSASAQQVLPVPSSQWISCDTNTLNKEVLDFKIGHNSHSDGLIAGSADQPPSVEVISPPSGGIYNYMPTLTIHFNDDLGLDCGYYQG
jgi:hypothetical protein